VDIGKTIKENRTKKGETQEDLSNYLYVSRQLVSKWENGKSYPDLNQLIQLSDHYNLSLDELMRGNKKMLDKKDSQIKLFRKSKKIGLILIAMLIFGSLYNQILTYKTNSLYRNLEEQGWKDEGVLFSQQEDSIRYAVYKISTYNIFAIPDKLPIFATAEYSMDNMAFITGVRVNYSGDSSNFGVSWTERDLKGQSIRMDTSFEYKKEIQPLENQTISYEFEKVFARELDIERPYLKVFLDSIEKKWKKIN
jgi:transcriptional regulator with XRE-family HTH domain